MHVVGSGLLFCLAKRNNTEVGFFWVVGLFFVWFWVFFVALFFLFLKLQEEKLNAIKTSTVMYWKLFSSY